VRLVTSSTGQHTGADVRRGDAIVAPVYGDMRDW